MAKIAIAVGAAIGFALLFAFVPPLAGLFATQAGAALFGGSLGLTVGNVLANALFPMHLPGYAQPPLLSSSSSNGAPIPIGYGSYRFAGNIIWSPGLKEHSKTSSSGGKGGPSYKSTNYTYTASFACAWGEGPGTILKIWFDSKIGYDNTTGTNTATYTAPTFYSGNELQMPDPLIQGFVGVTKTPAFRGLIYAVWEDLLLSDFGNRIPNLQALIQYSNNITNPVNGILAIDGTAAVGTGNGSHVTTPATTPQDSSDWAVFIVAGNGSISPRDAWGAYDSTLSGEGAFYSQVLPTTATSIAGNASISSGDWAATCVTFSLIGPNVPSIVQVASASGAFSAPEALSFSGSTVMGNTIILVSIIDALSSGDAEVSLTDTQNNSYQQVHVVQNAVELDVFITQGCPAGPNTFTLNGTGGGTNWKAAAYEIQAGALATTGLNFVVQDICTRAGLAVSTQVDVSQVVGKPVRGYLISTQTDAASALKNPLSAFFVDGVESDFKLKFIPRGVNASVMTIPESDLGLVADKAELQETISQQQEMPREIDIVYVDPTIDWQQNKTHKQRSSRTVKTKQIVSMNLPMVFTPAEARQIAEKALYLAYLERRPYDFNLWKMAYAVLDPTDVVQFVYEGITYQARLVSTGLGVSYSITAAAVSESSNAYLSTAPGGSSFGPPGNSGAPLQNTVLFMLDVPYLQDSDAVADRSSTGYYWGASAPLAGWPGCVLFKSADDTTFQSVDSSTQRMVYGVVVGTLGDPPLSPWVWDTVNTLTIVPADPAFTFAGTSDLDVYNGANVLIVGNEAVQYANAVQNDDGSYTLSRLLRGRRNTEPFAYGHSAGESFFDPTTGLLHEGQPLVVIGLLRYYRAPTVGQDVTAVSDTDLTLEANDLKPAMPVHIAGTRDMSGNLTIGWVRRTRYAGDWLNNTGNVPLNEDSEQYDVDIYGVSPPGVVRTIHWTPGTYDVNGNPIASYTAAQQAADFGSTQSSVVLDIYQISAQVGRGFPGSATV